MKKTNLIIAGLVVTNLLTIGSIGFMSRENQEVTEKYDGLISSYEELRSSYEDANNKHKELEEQVYLMMEDKDYKFTIEPNKNEFITYERTNSDSWFPDETKSLTILHY